MRVFVLLCTSSILLPKFPLYYPAPHDGCVANNGIAMHCLFLVSWSLGQIMSNQYPHWFLLFPNFMSPSPQVSLFHVPKVVKPNKKLGLGLVVLVLWTSYIEIIESNWSFLLHPSPGPIGRAAVENAAKKAAWSSANFSTWRWRAASYRRPMSDGNKYLWWPQGWTAAVQLTIYWK